MRSKAMRYLGVTILILLPTLACQISPKVLCFLGILYFPTETIAVAEEYLQEESERIANTTGYRFTFEGTDLDVCSGVVSTNVTTDYSSGLLTDEEMRGFLDTAIWISAMHALYRATTEAEPAIRDPIHTIVVDFSAEPRFVWGRVQASMTDMAALEAGEITLEEFLDTLRIEDHWDFEQLPGVQ